MDDSNDGGPIDQDAELPGDEREDDDEGGSEDLPDFPEEEGRYHTMAEHLSKLDGLAVRGCADKFFYLQQPVVLQGTAPIRYGGGNRQRSKGISLCVRVSFGAAEAKRARCLQRPAAVWIACRL